MAVLNLKTKWKCKSKNSLEEIFYTTIKWVKHIDQAVGGPQDVMYSTQLGVLLLY